MSLKLLSVAGERYVYKFICDPRALFSLAGFGGDNTAAALHYHAAAAAAGYPGMHGHAASLLPVSAPVKYSADSVFRSVKTA